MSLSVAFILILFILHTAISTELLWNESLALPLPIYNAAFGSNQNHTFLFIFGGLNNTGYTNQYKHSHDVLQFNGTNFKKISTINLNPYNPGDAWQTSTTIKDIIYFKYQNTPFFRFNTTSLQFESSIPHMQDFDGNGYCLTSNDTHLFYFGCYANNGNTTDCLRIYSITNNQWTTSNQLSWSPYFLSLPSCGYYNHTLYIFGGRFCNVSNILCNNIGNYIIKYHDVSNTWTMSTAVLSYKVELPQVIMPKLDGIFYIFAGTSSSKFSTSESYNTVNIFDANIEKTYVAKSLLYNVVGSMVGYINERIYVFGGYMYPNGLIANGQMSDIIEVNISYSTDSPTVSPTKLPSNMPTVSPTETHHQTGLSKSTMILIIVGASVLALVIICIIKMTSRKKQRIGLVLHQQRLIDETELENTSEYQISSM